MPKTVEEKAAVAAAEAAGNLNVSIVLPPADTWDKKLNVYQRLLKVVAEVNHVDKSGRNEFHKYDYVKAADLAHPIRNALTENGVFAEFDITSEVWDKLVTRNGEAQHCKVVGSIVFINVDTPTDRTEAKRCIGEGSDNGDKASYKAMTGAVKYALRNAFLVPDQADPEADTAMDEANAGKGAGKPAAKVTGKGKGKSEERAEQPAAKAEPSKPAIVEPTDAVACDDCHEEVKAVPFNDTTISIGKVLAMSQKRYSKNLCAVCQKKHKDAEPKSDNGRLGGSEVKPAVAETTTTAAAA